MLLTSSAFAHGDEIPILSTCDGLDQSPPLAWTGAPPETESLALILFDPDAPDPAAPKMTWIHWILYNIPAHITSLPPDVDKNGLPNGTMKGRNSWDRTSYGGPCPPIGRHRYFFELYALDSLLPDLNRPDRSLLKTVMAGHVLDTAQLMGTYQR